jgi:hypothetical protein
LGLGPSKAIGFFNDDKYKTQARGHSLLNQYFVSITRGGKPPQWQWEISRRPKPLGVRFYASGFRSEKAAKLAGEKALRELVDGLAREQSKSA